MYLMKSFPCFLQSDIRTNGTDVRLVSKATDNLLESLGSLAVEVDFILFTYH